MSSDWNDVNAPKDYSDGRTLQAFKDECDINRILHRGEVKVQEAHLDKYGAQYADYVGFDWAQHQQQMAEIQTMFNELPAETRKEFGHNPGNFLDFVTDPQNAPNLAEVLPALAQPGYQFPNVRGAPQVPPEAPEPPAPADPPAEPPTP